MESESEMNPCAICGSSARSFCGGCKNIYYCSQAHQKQDWKNHKEMCTSFKTSIDLETGKEHLVASRDLKAGTIVLEETAAFYSPLWFLPLKTEGEIQIDEDLDPICVVCGKLIQMLSTDEDDSDSEEWYEKGLQERSSKTEAKEFNSCSKCAWPVCSWICELNSIHADNECKLFTQHKVSYPPPEKKDLDGSTHIPSLMKLNYTVAMLRGVGVKKKNPELFRKILGMGQDCSLTDGLKANYCMSALDHISYLKSLIHDKESDKTPATEIIALPLEDEAEYLKVYQVIQEHQFIVTKAHFMWGDPYHKSTMYIYPKARHISHSCVPNSSWSIGPAPEYKLRIRTAVLVKKGERLTVSRFILPESHCTPTSHRQAILTEQGIVCKCDRCTDPTEMGLYYSAVECPSCREHNAISKSENLGYLLPISPLLGKKTSWECNNRSCKYKMDAAQHQKMMDGISSRLKEEAEKNGFRLNQLKSGNTFSKDFIYWDEIANAAEKLGESFGLHPNHTLTHTAIKNCVDTARDAGKRIIWSNLIVSHERWQLNFETYNRRLRRLSYCLTIEDKISPGLSIERAHLSTIMLKLMIQLLPSRRWAQLNTPTQIRDYLKLFKQCCAESLKYFENDFHTPGKTKNLRADTINAMMLTFEIFPPLAPWLR